MVTLVQKLVRGSSEINRMNDEISLVLGMLRSMIPSNPVRSVNILDDGGGLKELKLAPNRNCKLFWVVRFFLGREGWTVRFLCFSDVHSNDNLLNHHSVLNHRDVLAVYQELDGLVERLLVQFPELNDAFAPFIKVADRK